MSKSLLSKQTKKKGGKKRRRGTTRRHLYDVEKKAFSHTSRLIVSLLIVSLFCKKSAHHTRGGKATTMRVAHERGRKRTRTGLRGGGGGGEDRRQGVGGVGFPDGRKVRFYIDDGDATRFFFFFFLESID